MLTVSVRVDVKARVWMLIYRVSWQAEPPNSIDQCNSIFLSLFGFDQIEISCVKIQVGVFLFFVRHYWKQTIIILKWSLKQLTNSCIFIRRQRMKLVFDQIWIDLGKLKIQWVSENPWSEIISCYFSIKYMDLEKKKNCAGGRDTNNSWEKEWFPCWPISKKSFRKSKGTVAS